MLSVDQVALAILLSWNVNYNSPVDDHDLLCMSHAVYFEASGESLAGKLAVANVINNRLKSLKFASSVCDVVKQKHQFSYVLEDNKQHLVIENFRDYKAFDESVMVSITVLSGDVEDTTNGSDHYLNKKAVSRIPQWYHSAKSKQKIGAHTFVALN